MKVIYPGTFDPPTKGHLSLIARASALFKEVVVAIGVDTEKKPALLTVEERVLFLEELTQDMANVEVSFFEGLAVKHAEAKGAHALLRSLRTYTDFEHERTLAHTNKKMGNLETLYLYHFGKISCKISAEIFEEKLRLEMSLTTCWLAKSKTQF